MKALFRILCVIFVTVPLLACAPETGSLNKNQDPSDPAAQTEHDLEGEPPPIEEPPE